jgi:hypothetical protein
MERKILGFLRHARSSNDRGDVASRTIDVAAALSDPELVSALEVQKAASQNRIRNLQRLQQPTTELIQLLASELGRQ